MTHAPRRYNSSKTDPPRESENSNSNSNKSFLEGIFGSFKKRKRQQRRRREEAATTTTTTTANGRRGRDDRSGGGQEKETVSVDDGGSRMSNFQILHRPDRPQFDKQKRERLSDDEYEQLLVKMQQRNEAKRRQQQQQPRPSAAGQLSRYNNNNSSKRRPKNAGLPSLKTSMDESSTAPRPAPPPPANYCYPLNSPKNKSDNPFESSPTRPPPRGKSSNGSPGGMSDTSSPMSEDSVIIGMVYRSHSRHQQGRAGTPLPDHDKPVPSLPFDTQEARSRERGRSRGHHQRRASAGRSRRQTRFLWSARATGSHTHTLASPTSIYGDSVYGQLAPSTTSLDRYAAPDTDRGRRPLTPVNANNTLSQTETRKCPMRNCDNPQLPGIGLCAACSEACKPRASTFAGPNTPKLLESKFNPNFKLQGRVYDPSSGETSSARRSHDYAASLARQGSVSSSFSDRSHIGYYFALSTPSEEERQQHQQRQRRHDGKGLEDQYPTPDSPESVWTESSFRDSSDEETLHSSDEETFHGSDEEAFPLIQGDKGGQPPPRQDHTGPATAPLYDGIVDTYTEGGGDEMGGEISIDELLDLYLYRETLSQAENEARKREALDAEPDPEIKETLKQFERERQKMAQQGIPMGSLNIEKKHGGEDRKDKEVVSSQVEIHEGAGEGPEKYPEWI